MTDTDHPFPIRVQRTDGGAARAYARGTSFDVGSQASLRESDSHPSAVEYALGALGGDLLCGFEREAAARGLKLHAIELALTGRLDNVLVHLGVIGEEGHAGFAAIDGTAYVGTEAHQQDVEIAWESVRRRSPLYTTLSRAATVTINLRIIK